MRLRVIVISLCLMGMGLVRSPRVIAEQTTSPQSEVTAANEAVTSLPWQFFASTPGKYVVDLPGTPAEETGTSLLLERELRWQMSTVTRPAMDEGDLFEYYLVAHADIPRILSYEHSQKDLLDAVVTSVIEDIQDEQLNDTLNTDAIAFRGLPARLLTGKGLGQGFVAILTLTGDRVYLLLAIDDDPANFEHFYSSFSLVP